MCRFGHNYVSETEWPFLVHMLCVCCHICPFHQRVDETDPISRKNHLMFKLLILTETDSILQTKNNRTTKLENQVLFWVQWLNALNSK